MQGKGEDIILQPCPSPLLSLGVTLSYITLLNIFFIVCEFEQKHCWIKIHSYTPHACRKI